MRQFSGCEPCRKHELALDPFRVRENALSALGPPKSGDAFKVEQGRLPRGEDRIADQNPRFLFKLFTRANVVKRNALEKSMVRESDFGGGRNLILQAEL